MISQELSQSLLLGSQPNVNLQPSPSPRTGPTFTWTNEHIRMDDSRFKLNMTTQRPPPLLTRKCPLLSERHLSSHSPTLEDLHSSPCRPSRWTRVTSSGGDFLQISGAFTSHLSNAVLLCLHCDVTFPGLMWPPYWQQRQSPNIVKLMVKFSSLEFSITLPSHWAYAFSIAA